MQLSLALNALLLALVVALLLKRSTQPARQSAAIAQASSPRLKLKQSVKAIDIAANNEDLVAVREGILAWGRCAFPDAKIKTLDEIVQLCGEAADPSLWQQFRLLDQSLYNRESDQKADLKLLVALLKSLDIPAPISKTSTNGLKPLYPSDNIG